MKPLMIAAAILALAAARTVPALAQDAPSPPDAAASPPGDHPGGHRGGVRQACADDIAKLCADVDRPAVRQCMTDKFDQLSDGCKTAITAMRARHQSGGEGPPPAPGQPAP